MGVVRLEPGWLMRQIRAATIYNEEHREADRRARERVAAEQEGTREETVR